MSSRSKLKLSLASLCAVFAATQAHAQATYPEKPITLVVPFAAGSGSDNVARILAKELGDSLKATVIVDNKPGANGSIGAQLVARAKPDGYTLLLGSGTVNAANYAFSSAKLGYDPASFDFISGLGYADVSLYIPSTRSWKNIEELIADAKKNPGTFSCASGNAVTQVACEYFKHKAGVDVVTVPYRGNSQSLTDLVGGQLSYAFSDGSAAQVFLASKKIRALAVAADKRNPLSPDIATFDEQGIKDFHLTAWGAVFAPAGTPQPIAEKLNAALLKIIDSPDMVQSRSKSGASAMRMDLATGKRFVDREVQNWKQYVKVSGVKTDQ